MEELLNRTVKIEEIYTDRLNNIPYIHDYYIGLNIYATLSIVLAFIIFFLNLAVFCSSTSQTLKRVKKQHIPSTLFLLGIYPIVSLAALTTILIPKSFLICHTVMHLVFAFGTIVYYRLCILYVDGVDNFIKNADAEIMNIRTPPFCCCCVLFKPIAATNTRMRILFYMIIQLPCIQFSIMFVLNCVHIFEESIFKLSNLYFAPFMFTSILTAVWSLNIITKMTESHMKNHNMKIKFFVLQMILICCKLQYIILNVSLDGVYLGSDGYPITDTVYKQAIVNLLILLEMFPLSLLAKKAYRVPTSM